MQAVGAEGQGFDFAVVALGLKFLAVKSKLQSSNIAGADDYQLLRGKEFFSGRDQSTFEDWLAVDGDGTPRVLAGGDLNVEGAGCGLVRLGHSRIVRLFRSSGVVG